MSEVETWLREQLHSAVPDDLQDVTALLTRVPQQARRDRRVRVSLAAAVIAVLAIASALVAGGLHHRVSTPARPVRHLACSQLATAPAAALPPAPGPLSAHLREVLVCSDRSASSVWQGFLPADSPVSTPSDLDYLRLDVPSGQRCPKMPNGPAYRFLLLDQAGRVSVIDNRRLACNGWPALNRYFIAQGDQMAAEIQAPGASPFPKCTSMLHSRLQAHPGAPPALRKGTVLTAASLCGHPLADDLATPAKEPQLPMKMVLSAEQLSRLNTELAHHGSVKGLVACRDDSGWVEVLRAVTSTGATVTLTGPCANSTAVYVNGAQDDTITLLPSTLKDLSQ